MLRSHEFGRELDRLRRDHAVIRAEWRQLKRIQELKRFNPSQPRQPAGQPGGGRWTDHLSGGLPEATAQPVFFQLGIAAARTPAARYAIEKTISAALSLYTQLTTNNKKDETAIISFRAREYTKYDASPIPYIEVKNLTERETQEQCPHLKDVQRHTNLASEEIKATRPGLRPAEHGTAVHRLLQINIDNEYKDTLDTEVSYVKSDKANAEYGTKGSIRIDVIEKQDERTICIYDIKTGNSKLTNARINEIFKYVSERYSSTSKIIITEIKPQ